MAETYDSIRQCRAEVEQAKVFYAENGWEVRCCAHALHPKRSWTQNPLGASALH